MTTKKRLDTILAALLGSYDAAEEWWISPNTSFAMQTPIELWEGNTKEREEVCNYILSQKVGECYYYKCD